MISDKFIWDEGDIEFITPPPKLQEAGTASSGDHGHSGRPGERGGSQPSGKAVSTWQWHHDAEIAAGRAAAADQAERDANKDSSPGSRGMVADASSQTAHWDEAKQEWSMVPKDQVDTQIVAPKSTPISNHPDEAQLATLDIIRQQPLGGGSLPTELVHFSDTTKGVFKSNAGELETLKQHDIPRVRDNIVPGTNAQREVGAWQVARIAGMDDLASPTVFRTVNGQEGSIMRFRDGDIASNKEYVEAFDGDTDIARTAAFDYVIGNEDRHRNNWLISEDGKDTLQLIDHGLSFPEQDTFGKVWGNYKMLSEAEYREGTAAHSSIPPPRDVSTPYTSNKAEILSTLATVGLSKESIHGVSLRIGRLSRAKSWNALLSKLDYT